jgi:hypothetical protein
MMPHAYEHDENVKALKVYYARYGWAAPQTIADIRREVLTHLESRPRPAIQRLRGRLISTAGFAAVAAGAVVAASVLAPGQAQPPGWDAGSANPLPANVDGPTALRLVADHIPSTAPLTVSGSQILYSVYRSEMPQKAVGADGQIAWFVADSVQETWTSAQGAKPIRETITTGLDARPLSAADAARLKTSPSKWNVSRTFTVQGGNGPQPTTISSLNTPQGERLEHPTPAFLASLPTDPSQLLATIHKALPLLKPGMSQDSIAKLVFEAAATLATRADALLSPALRAALYQAMARIPGIQRVPGQVDLAGRKGVGVGPAPTGGERVELILDPTTSHVIGVQTVLLPAGAVSGLPPGTVLEWSTTDQKVVGSVGAKS